MVNYPRPVRSFQSLLLFTLAYKVLFHLQLSLFLSLIFLQAFPFISLTLVLID